MNVYVLRHAKAGSRSGGDGPDELRPLSKRGRKQAEALGDQLADADVARIVSSPYVRCLQSVEPLAARLHVPIEKSDALAEGAPLREALRLVEKVSDQPTLLCTHGDVVEELLAHAERQGVRLEGEGMEKGSTWILSVEHGTIVGAKYLPPPA